MNAKHTNETPVHRAAERRMLVYPLLGPIVWAIHFAIIYGAHTLVCTLGGGGAATLIVLIATVVALGLLAIPLVAPPAWRRPTPTAESASVSSFADRATRGLTLLSAIAVLWAGTTALIVGACTP